MWQLKVEYGQNIWDIGLQEYGHVTGAELLITDNPQFAITDTPVPGTLLLIRDEVPKLSEDNQKIVAAYKASANKNEWVKVASGSETNLTVAGPYVTTGYWEPGYVRENR